MKIQPRFLFYLTNTLFGFGWLLLIATAVTGCDSLQDAWGRIRGVEKAPEPDRKSQVAEALGDELQDFEFAF